jgi:outer membrane protein assembly factor BamA
VSNSRFSLIFSCLAGLALLLFAVNLQAEPGAKREPSPWQGKVIKKISIEIRDIFGGSDLAWLYRTANSLKTTTRQSVVRRELLFKEGGTWDDFHVQETERRLRALKYIRNIRIEPTALDDGVAVTVSVQETWTLIPLLSYSSSGGKQRRSAGIKESNLLGYGKRMEVSYSEDESRQIVETVYDDNQLFGSTLRFQGAYFDRNDGNEAFLYFGQPVRSLFDKNTWFTNLHAGDTVGRLFSNGEEDYIFRQKNNNFEARYTIGRGNPSRLVQRYTLGYDYIEDTFHQATLQDYRDLDLDPATVSNDPARLPANRRYSGPVFTYEFIEPDYISMNYIDRFDRVEDYNLGFDHDIAALVAPRWLGSKQDAAILSMNQGHGLRFSSSSFARGELGLASRLDSDGLSNSLGRLELKYYNVLGELRFGGLEVGRHTLAFSFATDYGDRFDRDRQLTLGADNGLRGYKARAFTGDRLLLINAEDRIHLVDDLFKIVSFGMAFFFDAGGATYEDYGSLYTKNLYADGGAGLRFAFPRSAGGLVARLDCGVPVRDGPDGTGGFEVRLVFAGGQIFSSRLSSETLGPERANVGIGMDQ